MNIVEQLQGAIDELLAYMDKRKNEIHSEVRVKYVTAYITSVMSYVNGVKILMKEEQYDSVLPVCRTFLEMYASICYMMEKYNNTSEFDEYFKKIVIDDMEQDRKIYNSFKGDATVRDEEKRQKVLDSYIQRWENFINKYFPDEAGNIVQSDKETSITEIVKRLHRLYSNIYANICGDKAKFIGDALKNNTAFSSKYGYEYDGSYIVYRVLCSETHGNIGAVDARSTYNGCFSINLSNKDNALAAAQCMTWCLKDIAYKFNIMFGN